MPKRLLNLLFPPQCLACDALVPEHGTLCLPCWQGVEFITDPACARCGYPFDFSIGNDMLCAQCLETPPSFGQARSAFRYNEASRPLITRLKFNDQTLLAKTYAPWLLAAGRHLVEDSDLILPVPLHYWRFVKRRYNQSALLAQALGKQSGLPVLVDGLSRRRSTRPQMELPRKERLKNVKGAFAVPPRHGPRIRGKAILLVDDVMTTRATAEECSLVLLAAGAKTVNILTLGRAIA